MHFHLPKPLHGWREFAGEVGIIVIGVLIALGAEEVVETVHGNAEVRQFRAAVSDELAYDLGSYKQRLLLTPCVRARLAELDQVIASDRAGRPIRMHGLSRWPVSFSLRTSVWTNRTGDVEARMPLLARLAYAKIYDDLANFDVHRVDERNAWMELGEFDDAQELSNSDLMRLRGLVSKLRWIDGIIVANWPEEAERGEALGIYPMRDRRDPVLNKGVCTSFLTPNAS
jgi:hypothetical protein